MSIAVTVIFLVGYLLITLEHGIRVNKAATALVTGVACWAIYLAFAQDHHEGIHHLEEEISQIASLIFFLIGAMTIVELIDIYGGFDLITMAIKTRDSVKLLWVVSALTFFLSAILDNLTTAIVMTSVVGKLLENRKERLLFVGMIVIASNAGGAWSPLGDVTTTMLWISHKISAGATVQNLILPSLVATIVPLGIVSIWLRGTVKAPKIDSSQQTEISMRQRIIVVSVGLGALILVPVLKVLIGLPPYLGMMLGLGLIWIVTELMHFKKHDKFKEKLTAAHALENIDSPSILFFMGILLAVGALQVTGVLGGLAAWLDTAVPSRHVSVLMIGLLSAVVDNVPMVAGAIDMYPITQYPALGEDASFWHFLAYCAGTGGSILIIGSAAGVAVMGIEKVEFFWYLKRISWLALAGYFAGAGTFLLLEKAGWLVVG
ncbi:MAG TPA: sodium:proton antiporter NhaD [Bacteroidia bacterium]|nr:sodium:proton antiporter NhaD [Bacteroidia bacterium]